MFSSGLSSKVTVLRGTLGELEDKLENILNEMIASHFDFIFMDHFKHCYMPDFLILENKNMLGKGTCIVADSVGYPEAQNYINYLNEHREEFERKELESKKSKWSSLLPCKMTVATYILEANLVT